MGHSSGHSHADEAQNTRTIFITLALFFLMTVIGHYVFVVRGAHHEESAKTHHEESAGKDRHDDAAPVAGEKEDKNGVHESHDKPVEKAAEPAKKEPAKKEQAKKQPEKKTERSKVSKQPAPEKKSEPARRTINHNE